MNLPLVLFFAICNVTAAVILRDSSGWFACGNAALAIFGGFVLPLARGVEKRKKALKLHAWRAAMERARRLLPAEKAVFAALIEREEKRRGSLMTAEELAKRLAAFGVAGEDCEKVLSMMKEVAKAGGAPVIPQAPPNDTIWK